eukprot:6190061-Pleurochrysis_carterae.AAC.4
MRAPPRWRSRCGADDDARQQGTQQLAHEGSRRSSPRLRRLRVLWEGSAELALVLRMREHLHLGEIAHGDRDADLGQE